MILDDFGYTTLIANGADEALLCLDGSTKIDLLFTDLIMPGGMNGVMLARAARRRSLDALDCNDAARGTKALK